MTDPSEALRRAVLFDAYPHVYGGAQRTDHALARRLPSFGWQLTTVVPGPGPFPDRLRADGHAVEVVPTPRSLSRYGRVTTGAARGVALLALPRYWLRLLRAFRRLRPDAIHVVDHRGLVLALVPARLSGARTVWHVQALDATPSLNRWGGRLAHCVVVPTRTVVPKLAGLGAVDDLRAIPNVVPDDARAAASVVRSDDPLIVSTARLHPDKGLDVLIDALALLRRTVPTARVRVLGGPQEGFEGYADELLERAGAQGVADAVELVGFVDQPRREVGGARCYVQPARERTEILPLAILEAMVAGTPVVATDVGGVVDVVRDGATGLVVPPEDAPALAVALERILTDPHMADELSRAALALVADARFTEDGLAAAVAAAYAGTPHG